MAVYYKISGLTTYFSGTQLDSSYILFDPHNSPNPTYGQNIIIQNPITLEGQEGDSLFEGCTNKTIEHLDGIDTSQATDFIDMFSNCYQLKSIDLSTGDTSNVTRMTSMFYGCDFLESIDLRGWDVSSLKSCSHMFYDCYYLSEIKTSEYANGKVDAPNLNDGGSNMFYHCSNLPGGQAENIDINSANTGNYFTAAFDPGELCDVYVKENDTWNKVEVYY